MSRPQHESWQTVARSRTELIAFCRQNGLPGEDPGPTSFLSVPPDSPCHTTGGLLWEPGSDSAPFSKSWACRELSCSYCASWMAGMRVGGTAGIMGVQLTPEYVGQIYNKSINKADQCIFGPHIQLFGHWFKSVGSFQDTEDLLQRQVEQLGHGCLDSGRVPRLIRSFHEKSVEAFVIRTDQQALARRPLRARRIFDPEAILRSAHRRVHYQ